MKSKRIAYIGLLIALAFVFSYIEFLLPISLGIPGVKLGLANLVILVCFYQIGEKEAGILSLIRVLLVGFTFANMAMMLYSLAGAILSFLAMYLAKRTNRLSITGVSVLGAVFHNIGQILMAMLLLRSSAIISYLPVLMVTGVVAGIVIGLVGAALVRRLGKRTI
ncbi:MAG: Gx transporter family protein [Agathobacter sp.]|nr:Gx transporter family protein [Agathobacter sp.]